MFTINVRKNDKWKDVVIKTFVIGDIDLGLLTDAECRELVQNFRDAAEKLERFIDAD